MKLKIKILSIIFLLLNSSCFAARRMDLYSVPIKKPALIYLDASLDEKAIEESKEIREKDKDEIANELKVLTELQKIGSNSKKKIDGIIPVVLSNIIMSYLEGPPSKVESDILIADTIVNYLNFKNFKIILDLTGKAIIFNYKNGETFSCKSENLRVVLPNGNIAAINPNATLRIFSDKSEKNILIDNIRFSKIEQLESGNLLLFNLISPTGILKIAQNWSKSTFIPFGAEPVFVSCALELSDEEIVLGTLSGNIIIYNCFTRTQETKGSTIFFGGITHILKLRNGKILTISNDGFLRIWDDKFTNYNCLTKNPSYNYEKFNYVFETSTELIITAKNGEIKVWDPIKKESQRLYISYLPHEEVSYMLELKDRKVAIASNLGSLVFLDLDDDRMVKSQFIFHGNSLIYDMYQLPNRDLIIFSNNITKLNPTIDINFGKQEKIISNESCCTIL